MSKNSRSEIEDLLSDQEIESIRFAQDLYGARAKEAVVNLADNIGLNTDTRAQLLGAVSLRLEELDFEQRREVAAKINELAAILGGVATEQSTDVTKLDLLKAGEGDSTSALSSDSAELEQEREGQPKKLTRPQRTWLNRLFNNSEAVEIIEQLTPSQRLQYVEALTDRYQSLPIHGAGAISKQVRAEQLLALMGGKSVTQIAKAYDTSTDTLYHNLAHMAKSIRKRLSQEELLAMIPPPLDSESAAVESELTPVNLSTSEQSELSPQVN